jgi:sigma54-dependent transcription regulator
MTAAEAARIRQQHEGGRLESGDATVRRVVDEANRTSVRGQLWGESTGARRITHGLLLTIGGGLVLYIGGLAVDIALAHP